ncbi:MAG: cyclic nucleotide-binding domain-containing protein, partial [Bacteroidota bacterium]
MQNREKPADLVAQLRKTPYFEDVEEDALAWLVSRSDYLFIPKGSHIFRTGDAIDHMQVILRGSYVIHREKDGRKRELGAWEAPAITGVLPFSRMTHVNAE